MPIKGSLTEMGLPDITEFISMRKKTGLLSITTHRNLGSIYFDQGKVVYANMVNREVKIGEQLLRAGEISEDQLSGALAKQRAERGKRLGEILLEMGAISEGHLREQIVRQIRETFFHLLSWQEGYFNFQPGLLPESEAITVFIDPEELIQKETERVKEWREIEGGLPAGDTILELVPMGMEEGSITPHEAEVLSLVDGKRSLDGLVEESRLLEFESLKVLDQLLKRGFVVEAGKKREELTDVVRQKVEEHLNLGIAFLRIEMHDEAKRELGAALETDPGSGEALFYLGVIDLLEAKYEDAVEKLEGARKVSPDRASVLNNLGIALEGAGRLEEAEKVLLRAKESSPDDPTTNLNLGLMKWKSGSLSEAEEALKATLEKNENLLTAYFLLSLMYLETGNHQQAVDYLKTAIVKNPEISSLHNNLGVVLEEMGEAEGAKQEYRRAIELEPSLVKARRNLSEFFYGRGSYEEAVEGLESLFEDGIFDSDLLFKLGNIYHQRGERERTIQAWEMALELDPGNPTMIEKLKLVKSE